MRGKTRLGSICALLLCSIFFMYQETPARSKRTAANRNESANAQTGAPDIRYTISMSRPSTHLLEVEMRLSWNRMPAKTQLKMPVWTPGSYLVREYARHVQDFSVVNGAGKPLTWQKINKNTWSIDTAGTKELVTKYRVYSNELTVRTNELNDEHGFWNNAALLMFPAGHLSASSTVTVQPYGKWKVATGLPHAGKDANTFKAANFDVLYDSPFEVSDF